MTYFNAAFLKNPSFSNLLTKLINKIIGLDLLRFRFARRQLDNNRL